MIDWQLVVDISVPLAALVLGVVLDRALERRPQLLAYFGQISSFTIRRDRQQMIINTHTVVVRNAGRRSANDVRIAHHYLPENINVRPTDVRHVIERFDEGHGGEIVFPTLRPGEEVHIAYLYFPPVNYQQINGPVRHADGFAKGITVLLQRQYPRWFQRVAKVVFLVGLVFSVYLLLRGGIWLFTSVFGT